LNIILTGNAKKYVTIQITEELLQKYRYEK